MCRTDFCMWGRPFRKATFFLSIGFDLAPAFEKRVCCGAPRGLCLRTGRPHHVLAGQDDAGRWLTKIAEPYPANMCNAIIRVIESERLRARARAFTRLALKHQ